MKSETITKKEFKELHNKNKLRLVTIPFGYRFEMLKAYENNPYKVLIDFLENNIKDIKRDNSKYLKETTNYTIDGGQFEIKKYGDYIIILENTDIGCDMVTYLLK